MPQSQRPPFTPYPAYKPSGAEWLGDIPAHWEVRPLKYLATIVSGATPSTIVPAYWDGDVPWITPQDLGRLTSRYIGHGARNISQTGYDACGTTLAPAKSLVISTRAPIGHTAILSSDACVNQGCRLLVPNDDAHSEFLYFQLTSLRSELASFGQGSTFTELSRMKLGGFKVAVPPLAEQRAIAAYLDRMGDLARRHADVTARLIACLRELRQGEIRQAVTRGLDADAPLRASGVEWLGDVPAHWEVKAVKYLATIVSGATPSSIIPAYWDGDVPWITPQDLGRLTSRYIGYGARNISQAGYDACGTTLAPAKSVAISTRAPIGHTAILQSDACVNQGCRLLVPKEDAHSEFLYFQLTSFRSELASFGQGSTFTELSRMKLGGFKLAVPPLAEQRAIAAHLDARTAAIDAAIAYKEREAALVGEYWTRLTSDAVTGQIDLRAMA